MILLTRAEEIVLLAVYKQRDNAYGVTIKRSVSQKTGRTLSYGGLYFMLAQLVKKDLVIKAPGEPTQKRGGRRKYYYTLTEKGIKALRKIYSHQKSLWEKVSKEVIF